MSMGLLILSMNSFAQRKGEVEESCVGQYRLANDYYINGDFERSLQSLEGYQACAEETEKQNKTSDYSKSDYLKLKSMILIVQEKEEEAKLYISDYVKTKFDNYYEVNDPELFKDLVDEELENLANRSITSLSKSPEDIEVAPASVLVIREEDFNKRGYLDIIDLLNDVPGFDISKIFATTYANVYQRGFRQDNTERTLVMIDGIEENDLWSNIAYLSRQYPLSNISSVEIIYGPASTIYGPRSFAGAINIVTKKPANLIKKKSGRDDPKLYLGISGKVTGASFGTQVAELNVAGSQKNFSFLLTGRMFDSDGHDMSNTPFFDYNPNDLNNLIYNEERMMSLSFKDNPETTVNELQEEINRLGLKPGSPFYDYYSINDDVTELRINPDSAQSILSILKRRDLEKYSARVNGADIGFSGTNKHAYFGGKILFNDFEFGFRTWNVEQNFNYYQDLFTAGAENGSNWKPVNSTFYSKYNKRFENISISNTLSYAVHGIEGNSKLVTYNSFFNLLDTNNSSGLSVLNFLFPDSLINGDKQGWKEISYFYKATQLRNDLKVNVIKDRFNALLGIEVRQSMLQGDYLRYNSYAIEEERPDIYPQEIGTVNNQDEGSNAYSVLDIGLYSQISYQFIPEKLYFTAAGRLDNNKIRSTGGFGTRFNPKFAMVYKSKAVVVKTIFSQGIQNPSQFTKFSTTGVRDANPNLGPERIRNLEFVVQGIRKTKLNWDGSIFISRVDDAVVLSTGNGPKASFNNIGSYSIIGSQGNLMLNPFQNGISFYANYSLTYSKEINNPDSEGSIDVADIARFKANFGLNIPKTIKQNRFNLNIRSNYVGQKLVGPGTTVPGNMGLDGTGKIPAYTIFNSSFMYSHDKVPSLRLQFTVNNIFNALYFSPGPRTANGNYVNNYNGFVPYVPQENRNYRLSLIFEI